MFCNQILFSQLLFHTENYNNKIGEKQREMGRPHGKDGCRHTSEESVRER